MFANKPNLNSLFTFEMSGLLINQRSSQSYLLLFQLLYLSTSGRTEISLRSANYTNLEHQDELHTYHTLQENTLTKY